MALAPATEKKTGPLCRQKLAKGQKMNWVQLLESQILLHKDDLHPSGRAADAGVHKVAANGVRTQTVMTRAGFGAGVGLGKPLGVLGRGHISGSRLGVRQRRRQLVLAYHYDNAFRPIGHGRHPVAIAVDVDQPAVGAYSVGAGEECIAQKGLAHQVLALGRAFGGVPVDELVALLAAAGL